MGILCSTSFLIPGSLNRGGMEEAFDPAGAYLLNCAAFPSFEVTSAIGIELFSGIKESKKNSRRWAGLIYQAIHLQKNNASKQVNIHNYSVLPFYKQKVKWSIYI